MPPQQQKLVFESHPDGTRLCVIATNVAETSLTIPNIKYVVDSGKVKEKVYDKMTGVSTFNITWISQASAEQRAGRAGRTAPGHCYRLYSSAVYNEFSEFTLPEIKRRPIDDVVLLMKAKLLPVINFPYPTPPDYVQIVHAIDRLKKLGALEIFHNTNNSLQIKKQKKNEPVKDGTKITELGRIMQLFPVAPRFGKMLALSAQKNLLPYSVILVAALTVPEVLSEVPLNESENSEETRKKWVSRRMIWSGVGNKKQLGDPYVLLHAVLEAAKADSLRSQIKGGSKVFCAENGLRHKAVVEVLKLHRQLASEINKMASSDLLLDFKKPLPTPDDQTAKLLRQILLLGFVDHVAKKVDENEIKDPAERPKWKNAYRSIELEDPIFLPSSSVLNDTKPQWIVYQEIYESNKLYIRGVTAIEPEWLCLLAPAHCSFSAPLETPLPSYDPEKDRILCYRSAKFGPAGWEIPDTQVEYPREDKDFFKWFAYFFLLGDICLPLKSFTKFLKEPKTLINPVAIRFRVQRDELLRTLSSQNATSLERLKEIWNENPKYLLSIYLKWINDDSIIDDVKRIWPPIIIEKSTDWD